jgi:hypothetical protein
MQLGMQSKMGQCSGVTHQLFTRPTNSTTGDSSRDWVREEPVLYCAGRVGDNARQSTQGGEGGFMKLTRLYFYNVISSIKGRLIGDAQLIVLGQIYLYQHWDPLA